VGIAEPVDGAAAEAKPVKFIYKVLGNYWATQLHHTASSGEVVTLNDTGNIETAGSALAWIGEAAPEPNGNPNVLSASTLSEKGDSYITCIITHEAGNIVASETGRGASPGATTAQLRSSRNRPRAAPLTRLLLPIHGACQCRTETAELSIGHSRRTL
jgi:hypothetical protein